MRSCIRSPAHRRIMPDRIAPIPLARNLARSSAPDPRLSLSAARRSSVAAAGTRSAAAYCQRPFCASTSAPAWISMRAQERTRGLRSAVSRQRRGAVYLRRWACGEISGDSEISFRNSEAVDASRRCTFTRVAREVQWRPSKDVSLCHEFGDCW
jgi:hypothetical protein